MRPNIFKTNTKSLQTLFPYEPSFTLVGDVALLKFVEPICRPFGDDDLVIGYIFDLHKRYFYGDAPKCGPGNGYGRGAFGACWGRVGLYGKQRGFGDDVQSIESAVGGG